MLSTYNQYLLISQFKSNETNTESETVCLILGIAILK